MNKVMRKVIRLEEEKKKPIELIHSVDSRGWTEDKNRTKNYDKIVYLGRCGQDGDMFACYLGDYIKICRGHLNDGVY